MDINVRGIKIGGSEFSKMKMICLAVYHGNVTYHRGNSFSNCGMWNTTVDYVNELPVQLRMPVAIFVGFGSSFMSESDSVSLST